MTAAEVADLSLREEAQAQLSIVDDYVAANALQASYAGTWTDHRNGGLIYVGFTGLTGLMHFDAIKNQYPYPDRLRSFTAVYSRVELDRVHAQIVADLDALKLEGIVVRAVATMNENNRVEVGVETLDSTVELRLKARYGLSLFVFAVDSEDDASREQRYRRLYSGLSLHYDAVDGAACTAAFSLRSRQPTKAGNYKYGLATAGHCAGKRLPQWFQGGRRIGQTRSSTYKNGASYATEKIEIDSQLISSTRRLIGKRIWLPAYTRKLVQVENEFRDEHEGNIVCMTGRVTGVSCGDLKTTNASKTTEDGVKLVAQRFAEYESAPGDSGAAIYRRLGDREAIAVGVHQGRWRRREDLFNERRVYGHVNNLEQAYNSDVCVVGRCPT
jgi:hypothetical protein